MKKFEEKFQRNRYGYEVGEVSLVLSKILLSKIKIVTLSSDTLKKNLNHHPDLTENDYLLLDDIVGKSHFVAQDGERSVAMMLNEDNNELYKLEWHDCKIHRVNLWSDKIILEKRYFSKNKL